MRTLFLIYIFLYANHGYCQDQLFKQYGGWGRIKKEAAATDKKIFLYFGATWCSPCNYLKKNIFTDPSVIRAMKKEFVSCSFDIDREPALPFLKKYRITAVPLFLIFDHEGRLLNRTEEIDPTVAGFLAQVDTSRMTPRKYKGISERLDMRWPAFYDDYFNGHMKVLPDSMVVARYLSTQHDLTSEVNWDILSLFNVGDEYFLYTIANKQKFIDRYGIEADFKLLDMYRRMAQKYIDSKDSVGYNRITFQLLQPNETADKATWRAYYMRLLKFLGNTGMDWDRFLALADTLRRKFGQDDNETIVQYAFLSKLNVKVNKILLEMMDTVLQSRPYPRNYFMYSILQLKTGEKEKAQEYLDKTILSCTTKEDKKEYQSIFTNCSQSASHPF
ncbi:MAG: thioredoxin family protein [Bacteroidetes bacterium]|nr:thioredoxin family protein [Bacteroidota bacterium]